MTIAKLPFEKIERKILIKKEAETDEKYGIEPKNRNTEEIVNYGVVNIDKPAGPTLKVGDLIRFQTLFKRFFISINPVTLGL